MESLDEIKKSDLWTLFEQQDPFNLSNSVKGYVCRRGGDDYGAIFIERVNGEKVYQLIYCTPKISYPFDHAGRWHFPSAKTIERYEKLDGTNIFAYHYRDHKGNTFISYKTRLTPFVRQSKFGPFLDMWNEILESDPDIKNLPERTGLNISFELWGARNPHLIQYNYPLRASVLFARDGSKILPPSRLPASTAISAPFRGSVNRDYVYNYEEAQKVAESSLVKNEDGNFSGVEGEVWYFELESGDWIMFKCKPETIEQIHWSAGGLNKYVIIATCQNALENYDAPTLDQINELLKEEFSEVVIEKFNYLIQECLEKVLLDQEFKVQVLKEYASLGLNLLESKSAVMRALSNKFQRNEMSKVYSIVAAEAVRF